MNRLILNALVAAGLATAVPMTFAQTAVPGNPQGPHHAQGAQHGQHAFRLPGERVEARLAYLKTALKITEAQQPQWDAFAGVMRKQAQESDARIKAQHEKMAAHDGAQHPSAIERLERRQAFMATAAARLGERLAVEKPLYAALTPEQQQIADQVLAGGGHRGRHGGQGGMHRNHGRA